MKQRTNAVIVAVTAAVATSIPAVSAAASFRPSISSNLPRVHSIPRGGSKSNDPKKKRRTRKRRSNKDKAEKKVDETRAEEEKGDKAEINEDETTAEATFKSRKEPSTDNSTASNTHQESPSSSEPKKPRTPPVVEEILKEEDYYKILGLTKQEAKLHPTRIKKSYRRRALQTHPDKTGGDRRAFDKVAKAYEVLSDDQQRALYDRFGKQGLEQGGAGGFASGFGNAEDLFRSFFGGRDNPYFQQTRRNRTVRYQLEVTLEDLYKGLSRTVSIAPDGSHAKAKDVHVHVPRGALNGQSIVLSGEMDFDTSDTPGDLIFLVKQRPHPHFTRKGHDLAVTMQVSLQEAICGVTRKIRHLDGHEIVIGSARHPTNDPILIQTGDVQVLKGQGMPKDAHGTDFGDLYVQYQVEMPKKRSGATDLSSEEREELGRLLDKLEGTQSRAKKEVPPTKIQYLERSSLADFGRASGRPEMPREHMTDDEEEPGFSPFGSRRFHWSSAASNPFFGMREGMFDDDDANVQCRQM